MRIGVQIQVAILFCIEQRVAEIEDRHVAVRAHMGEELIEPLRFFCAGDEPVGEVLGIDALLVRRDDKEIADAALPEPVAASGEQRAPGLQLRVGERPRTGDVVHRLTVGEKQPVALPLQHTDEAGVVEELPTPLLFPSHELVPESEVIGEIGLEPGREFAKSREARLADRKRGERTVFIWRPRAV